MGTPAVAGTHGPHAGGRGVPADRRAVRRPRPLEDPARAGRRDDPPRVDGHRGSTFRRRPGPGGARLSGRGARAGWLRHDLARLRPLTRSAGVVSHAMGDTHQAPWSRDSAVTVTDRWQGWTAMSETDQ